MLANYRAWWDWDWAGADREFKRAIELNPNFPDARAYYSHVLMYLGRPDESMRQARRALELDPFNALFQGMYGYDLIYVRRWDDAIAQAHSGLKTAPDDLNAPGILWFWYGRKGMYKEAFAAAKTYWKIYDDRSLDEALELGFRETGYRGAMTRGAEALAARFQRSYANPYDMQIVAGDGALHGQGGQGHLVPGEPGTARIALVPHRRVEPGVRAGPGGRRSAVHALRLVGTAAGDRQRRTEGGVDRALRVQLDGLDCRPVVLAGVPPLRPTQGRPLGRRHRLGALHAPSASTTPGIATVTTRGSTNTRCRPSCSAAISTAVTSTTSSGSRTGITSASIGSPGSATTPTRIPNGRTAAPTPPRRWRASPTTRCSRSSNTTPDACSTSMPTSRRRPTRRVARVDERMDDAQPVPPARFVMPAHVTHLLLVRHGESAPVVADRADRPGGGPADPPLSARGHEEAARVGARLAEEPIAAIYVSSLRRTAETAAPWRRRSDWNRWSNPTCARCSSASSTV